jgi:hypothetical protein
MKQLQTCMHSFPVRPVLPFIHFPNRYFYSPDLIKLLVIAQSMRELGFCLVLEELLSGWITFIYYPAPVLYQTTLC